MKREAKTQSTYAGKGGKPFFDFYQVSPMSNPSF